MLRSPFSIISAVPSLIIASAFGLGIQSGTSPVPPKAVPQSKDAGDLDGMEGEEETRTAPKANESRRGGFDAKAFFAAWGTENPQFDHDGNGIVDCPDLEHAIRQAGGGRPPANPGTIVLTPSGGKDRTITARGGSPGTLVKAWGTDAAQFDFDENGIVGCGDVPGFIDNGLKPLAPGQKPLQAPAADPRKPALDPSLSSPSAASEATGSASTGASGDASDPKGGRTPPGAGSGRGGRGGGGGGGGGGAGSSRAAARPPAPSPSSTFSGGGGIGSGGGTSGGDGVGNGGGGSPQPARGEVAIRYRAGTPGTSDASEFTWVVSGVRDTGTFVDGTPWITVDPDARLVDLSPRSVRKRTTVGIEVWIDGSAKNPIARRYIDPESLAAVPVAGLVFDGRSVRLKPPTQQEVDADYDEERNIGIVPAGERRINPVPLAPGDVIVTADSEWVENDSRAWGSGDGGAPNTSRGRRTAIQRYGVLTVLREAPTQPCFRPPLQWIPGEEANRPAPIPVARIRSDERTLLHNTPHSRRNPDHFLSGPTFHDGGGIVYQSSHATYALTTDLSGGANVTYGGNLARGILGPALHDATNLAQPSERRERIRNRLIQYGIDCQGSVLSLVHSTAGAGQRAAELKPWMMLAGWWLDEPSLRNPYQALRDRWPNTALAAGSDAELGVLFFHDDHVCRQVIPGLGYIQRWGPGQAFRVASASLVATTSLCDIEKVNGSFGRLELTGVTLKGDVHARRPHNFYGRYLKIDSGAGSGSTVYRVVRVGGEESFADWIEIDRPWAHGLPDATSSVCMFPFRNGDAFPGDVADLGRWYYSREAQLSSLEHDDLSPLNDSYAKTSASAFILPYAALKALADRTGNRDYLRGTTWNWLAEVVGGTGTAPTGERYGACPDSDRILNLFWDQRGFLGSPDLAVAKAWMGVTGSPGSFGSKDLSRVPGVGR